MRVSWRRGPMEGAQGSPRTPCGLRRYDLYRRRPHGVRGDRGEPWSRCFQLRAKLTGSGRALDCCRSCAPMSAPSAISISRSSRLRALGPLSEECASVSASALLPKAAGDQWYSVSSSILRTTPQPQAAVERPRTGASARRHTANCHKAHESVFAK